MEAIFNPWLLISIFVFRSVTKKFFKFEAEVIIGTFFYFLLLVLQRLGLGSWRLSRATYNRARAIEIKVPERPQIAHSVLDLNNVYRLKDLEVILGFDHNKRPVRIDLDKFHTLISGVTGSGKTVLLNGIIAQLVSRPDFKEKYSLYLLDLKSSKHDYLKSWAPVVDGYYPIDENGSSEAAINALSEIAESMHRQDTGKRIVVIIDELAMLTSQSTDNEARRRGKALLQRLAAQIRDRGAMIAATQRPHFEVIDRMVAANFEHKICLRVDDNNTDAKLILRFKPTNDATLLRDGEFILRVPGARNREQIGRSMLMQLPGEIDTVVSGIVEATAENDDRIRLFKMACNSLVAGAPVPGVNKMALMDGFNAEYIKGAYINYAQAGAFVPVWDAKRNQTGSYKMAQDYLSGVRTVVSYIGQGKWEAAPKPIKQ